MTLNKEFIILRDNANISTSITAWIDNENWIRTEIRSQWTKCFLFFPKRSCFSKTWLWGNNYVRNVKYIFAEVDRPVLKNKEYASQEEVYEDKLNGAV